MREDVPDTADTEEAERLCKMIRFDVEIYGLTKADIDFFKNVSNKILSERDGDNQRP